MKMLVPPQSGSYAGVTSSRNSYGQYLRTRATPVNPGTTFQVDVRARFSTAAGAWRNLTEVQQAGWRDLAGQIARNDSLGQSYTPSGFGAYCMVNLNRQTVGLALLDDPPLYAPPVAADTATLTATASTLSLAYTVTPLATGIRALAFVSPGQSAGRYYNGNLRLIQFSAAAAASPMNLFTAYSTRFGAPVVGSKLFASIVLTDGSWVSSPVLTSAIVA